MAQTDKTLADKEAELSVREAALAMREAALRNPVRPAHVNTTGEPMKMRTLVKRWKGGVMLEPGDPYMLAPGRKYDPKTLQPFDLPMPVPATSDPNARPPGAGPVAKKSSIHPLG